MATTEDFAKRYARAFLQAVAHLDDGALDGTRQELLNLSFLSEEPSLSFFLNPVFHMDEKKAVLDELFSKQTYREETKQFLHTLLGLNQLHLVESIAKFFGESLDEKNRETKISVQSAFPLSASEKDKIQKAFEKTTGKKVSLDVQVDRNLIGGVRAQAGGVVYDSSIQGHLLRLQKEFAV